MDCKDQYSAWNEIIYEGLFPITDSERSVYFQIDEEVLSILSDRIGENEQSLIDFVEVVKQKVVKDGKVELKHLFEELPDGVPGYISFLAVTVLAANYMGREHNEGLEVSSSNYYFRLSQLLGFSDKTKPRGLNNAEVESMWIDFSNRLRVESRGILQLTKGATTRRYVWYPISQTLLNREDRNKLKIFFKKMEFQAFTPFDRDIGSFDSYFSTWVRENNLSRRLSRIIEVNDVRKEELISQVRRELSRWDGSEYTKLSVSYLLKQSRAELMAENSFSTGWTISCILKRRKDWPKTIKLESNNGDQLEATSHADIQNFYDPVDLTSIPNKLNISNLKTIEGKPHLFQFNLGEVLVFYRDPRFYGALLSTERVFLKETASIVVKSNLMNPLLQILTKITEIDIEELANKSVAFLEGWRLIGDVTFLNRIEIEDKRFACLAVNTSRLLRFEKGLPLFSKGRKNCFLLPYRPEVVFVGDWTDQEVKVNGQQCSLEMANQVIGSLREGKHIIEFGEGQYRTFELLEPSIKPLNYERKVGKFGAYLFELTEGDDRIPRFAIAGNKVTKHGKKVNELRITPHEKLIRKRHLQKQEQKIPRLSNDT